MNEDDVAEVVELGPGDAAVVWRANGTKEAYLPENMSDEDMVSPGTPAYMVVRSAMALNDPDIVAFIDKKIEEGTGDA